MSKPKKPLVPPTRCVWESPSGNVVLDQHGVSVVSLPLSLDADALQVLIDAVRNARRFSRTEHAPTPNKPGSLWADWAQTIADAYPSSMGVRL